MARYWVRWISGNYADEGCTKPPFKHWITGQMDRPDDGLSAAELLQLKQLNLQTDEEYDAFLRKYTRDDCSICAVIDASTEQDVWKLVSAHFPDYRKSFCNQVENDFTPGDRFR